MKSIHSSWVCWLILSYGFSSCVSSGTYKALMVEKSKSDSLYTWAMTTLKKSQGDNDRLSKEKAALKDSVNDLNLQLGAVKDNNISLRKQLQELSAISSAQAESIKKSIDDIGAKDLYLQQLRTALSQRDSRNLAVLMEVKAAMGSFGDSVVKVSIARGEVRLTVANALLFGDDSTNYTVTEKGKTVLVRLARVLRDQPDISCRVEAYVDGVAAPADSVGAVAPDSASLRMAPDSATVRMALDSLRAAAANGGAGSGSGGGSTGAGGTGSGSGMDSWELEVRRAASVVEILQNQYNVTAARLTAAGYGEYGRGMRIVLAPPAEPLSEALEKR